MKKSYNAVDIAKFICALLVITIHTYPFRDINPSLNFVVVQVLARVAVPFFFVASAFFFFKKLNIKSGIDDEGNKNKLKNYILRVLKLYLVWSIIYLLIIIPGWIHGGFALSSILRLLRDAVFTGTYYHLWFLPAMVVSTVLVYWLYFQTKIRRTMQICLALYIIGMLVNVYGDYLMQIPLLSQVIRLYLSIFVTTRNGIFYGPIYTVIGLLLAKGAITADKKPLFNKAMLFLGLYFVETFIINKIGLSKELTSMYLMLVPFSFYLFAYVTKIDLTDDNIYCLLRRMSTVLYVSHLFFAAILGFLPITINSLIYYLFTVLLSIGFAYLVVVKSRNYPILKVLY